jgi:hypothetical protein
MDEAGVWRKPGSEPGSQADVEAAEQKVATRKELADARNHDLPDDQRGEIAEASQRVEDDDE